ncbi:HlyD family efflux transporter periplasmic adaptor subunit [Gammaproteobacteria bacterium AH-315-E17]|nr:HlyD family efflux transporter periplasmic adaptor subunit [Gammaproteobacteria bacterium AH-315-E17]
MNAPLFRSEVIDSQGERFVGDVILSQPLSHYFISGFLVVITFVGILFLASNNYSRKQSVIGFLVPDNGMVDVYPSQAGILSELKVDEDNQVQINSELFKLQIEQGAIENFYASDHILEELDTQEALLRDTMVFEELFLQNLLAQHDEGVLNLETEISQLEELRNLQEELSSLEDQAYNRARLLFSRGALAQASLEDVQKNYLETKIQLQNLDLTLVQKQAEFQKNQIDRETYIINSHREISNIENSLAELSKQRANTNAGKTNIIHSPVAGRITSLVAEIGQRVNPNAAVLSIIPANSVLEAQLYVPTRAIGFIQVGQVVNIRYDAFPYQRFGLYAGLVKSISNSILTQNDLPIDLQLDQPVYKVTVSLNQQSIAAYGEALFLKPGMLLSADVVLDERSLFEWLLEPLYSLRRAI